MLVEISKIYDCITFTMLIIIIVIIMPGTMQSYLAHTLCPCILLHCIISTVTVIRPSGHIDLSVVKFLI